MATCRTGWNQETENEFYQRGNIYHFRLRTFGRRLVLWSHNRSIRNNHEFCPLPKMAPVFYVFLVDVTVLNLITFTLNFSQQITNYLQLCLIPVISCFQNDYVSYYINYVTLYVYDIFHKKKINNKISFI